MVMTGGWFIVALPIQNDGSFRSYVSLPEGIPPINMVYPLPEGFPGLFQRDLLVLAGRQQRPRHGLRQGHLHLRGGTERGDQGHPKQQHGTGGTSRWSTAPRKSHQKLGKGYIGQWFVCFFSGNWAIWWWNYDYDVKWQRSAVLEFQPPIFVIFEVGQVWVFMRVSWRSTAPTTRCCAMQMRILRCSDMGFSENRLYSQTNSYLKTG